MFNFKTLKIVLLATINSIIVAALLLFNRDINRGCLVSMLSLRFLGSKFLINLRRQFCVRKIFRMKFFAGFAVFLFCV